MFNDAAHYVAARAQYIENNDWAHTTNDDKPLMQQRAILSTKVAEAGALVMDMTTSDVVEKNTISLLGRDYSSHAIEQMGERGVTPSAIEGAINKGISVPDPIPERMQYHVPGGGAPGQAGLSVITDSQSGRVITVIKRSSKWLGP